MRGYQQRMRNLQRTLFLLVEDPKLNSRFHFFQIKSIVRKKRFRFGQRYPHSALQHVKNRCNRIFSYRVSDLIREARDSRTGSRGRSTCPEQKSPILAESGQISRVSQLSISKYEHRVMGDTTRYCWLIRAPTNTFLKPKQEVEGGDRIFRSFHSNLV
ncbi:hypothetical protein TNCV_3365001 [Trichonephila clavipes]|nr:hypothetical protein TNCV_3365001 [Trichonephila clavipes]